MKEQSQKKYLWTLKSAEVSIHEVLSLHSSHAAKRILPDFLLSQLRNTAVYSLCIFNQQNKNKCLNYRHT